MSQIPCEIIQDLLPLYVDKLTSEATNREMKAHLDACADCRNIYEMMGKEPEITGNLSELPEIEYFRQVKRRNRRTVAGAVFAVLFIGAVVLLCKLFVIGVPVEGYYAAVTVEEDEILVEGMFMDSAYVFSRYRVEETDGEKRLVIYGRLPSFLGGDAAFSFALPRYEQTLLVNGMHILPDATVIEKQTQQLFEAKNPYIGNISADGRLSSLLGIGEKIGNFKTALQTTEEPYGWTFEFEDEWQTSDEEWKNAKMKDFACVLLALIENCGEIQWSYQIEGTKYIKSVDVKDAEELLEEPIKSYGEMAERLQMLLQRLGM